MSDVFEDCFNIGQKAGEEKGRREGEEKGRKEGKEEGRKEGKELSDTQNLKIVEMLMKGCSNDEILSEVDCDEVLVNKYRELMANANKTQ